MGKIIGTTIFLGFSVDFLLLLEAGRTAGERISILRLLLGAGMGSFFAGLSRVPGFEWLRSLPATLTVLAGIAAGAFWGKKQGLEQGLLFMLLRLALEGLALGLRSRSPGVQLLLAVLLALTCWWGMERQRCAVPVELCYQGRRMQVRGLRDTGNLLRDPLTGESVLVADAAVGRQLLGLSREQLQNPAQALQQGLPGRLIPYHSVGNQGGLLLALRLKEIRIGARRGEALVAFSPTELGGGYQLLLGGAHSWKN